MKIILDNVTKKIRKINIINEISYTFESGKIYGIVGRNGSGKTMLLRMVAGLIFPTDGNIYIDDKVLKKDISFPKEMGILIEKPCFLENMSGYDNLKMLADIQKKISSEVIKDYMKQFSLEPDSKQIMKKYSLGMKQKVGIIQAIMEEPKLLLLDEPFNALDKASVNTLWEILKEKKEKGCIILLTSHYEEDIDMLCDEKILIDSGKIMLER